MTNGRNYVSSPFVVRSNVLLIRFMHFLCPVVTVSSSDNFWSSSKLGMDATGPIMVKQLILSYNFKLISS